VLYEMLAGHRAFQGNSSISTLSAILRDTPAPVRQTRRDVPGEVQRIVAEEVPIAALWHEDNVVLTHRDVVGYQILPNARYNGLVTVEKR